VLEDPEPEPELPLFPLPALEPVPDAVGDAVAVLVDKVRVYSAKAFPPYPPTPDENWYEHSNCTPDKVQFSL